MSVAAKRGVSWVASESEKQRIVLTRLGRAAAVVESAQQRDADLRLVRETARVVAEAAADQAAAKQRWFTIDEACAQLGIDPAVVRARAAELAQQ